MRDKTAPGRIPITPIRKCFENADAERSPFHQFGRDLKTPIRKKPFFSLIRKKIKPGEVSKMPTRVGLEKLNPERFLLRLTGRIRNSLIRKSLENDNPE